MDAGADSDSECSPLHTPRILDDANIEPLHAEPDVSSAPANGNRDADKPQNSHEATPVATSLLGNLASETTSLLRKPVEFVNSHVHPGPCNHGTFSPTVASRAPSVRSSTARSVDNVPGSRGIFGSIGEILVAGKSGGKKKMSTTARLAQEHGIDDSHLMYV
jgi:hypothetical protein